MKYFYLTLALFIPFLMAACGEDEPTDVTHNTMKAKITIGSATSDYSSTSMSHSELDGKLNIISQTINSRMTLIFPLGAKDSIGMGNQDPASAIYRNLTTDVAYYTYGGWVNITSSNDARIEGKFSFKAKSMAGDSIEVKDGIFTYEY